MVQAKTEALVQNYDRRHWLRQLFRLNGSPIVAIAPHLLFVVASAAAVTFLVEGQQLKGIPLAIHALVGTVLGLILAFRTNTGYDRFWEGRKAWGAIVNRCRNLARMINSTNGIAEDTRRHLCVLVSSFAWAARRDLGHIERHKELDRLLGEAAANALEPSPGPPQRVLLHLANGLDKLRRGAVLDPNDHARFEADLAVLIDSLGVCHRIQKTPIPFAYAVFLRRFLLLYTLTLPFSLVDAVHWLTVPVVAMVGYALFGLEQIGVEIEDPFEEGPNDLDLFGICSTIERDVMGHFLASTGDAPSAPLTNA